MGCSGMIRAVLGVVVMVGLSSARADVVYDNTDPGGAVGIDHCPSGTEIGDEITITDAACGVTQIELGFTGPIGNVDLVVRLRANDFEEGGLFKPGTILFDSGTITVAATNAGLNTFTVPVPNVAVPTSFTWTIQHVGGPNICVPRYNPPTVGSSDDFFWVNNLGVFWFKSNSSFADNFYARVEAGGGGVGITCPAAVVLECPGDTSPAVTGEAVGEGCGTPVVTYADVSVAGCGNTETITRTWTADDGAGGVASCDQTITVVDTTAPTLAGVPGDVTVECDAVPAAATPTATDGCDVAPAVDFDEVRTDGACADEYVLTRTWTATDACGNSAQAAQTVTVVDTSAPMVSCPADATGLECPADTGVAALGEAVGSDNCGAVSVVSSDASVAGCGGTESITRTWSATDDCGNSANCDQLVGTVDTAAPVLTVDTTPIDVVDADCSGDEAVTLPVASAVDACDGVVAVTDDAPAAFAAGDTTTVTYTAADACGNAATAEGSVTVEYGATIKVIARKFTVGWGSHPGVTRDPLVGITIGAYDDSPGSCARTHLSNHWGILWWAVPDIIQFCSPTNSAVTDSNGVAFIDVPPGDYVIATHFDSDDDGDLDQYLAQRVWNLDCGEVETERLLMIKLATGRRLACKYRRLTGSELLIVEPEEVIWDDTVQQYPFVLDAEGGWDVTVSVTPPEGFVADHDELSEDVVDDVGAVQFTVTEVGSDLVPLKADFVVNHNRRSIAVSSEIGIALTPDYARSRGFDVLQLRQRRLIVDQVGPDGWPQRRPTAGGFTARPIRGAVSVSGD